MILERKPMSQTFKVVYRLTSIPSTNPSPFYTDDKTKLNILCLKSFVRAYASVKPFVHFICDNCPSEYEQMLNDYCTLPYNIEWTNMGVHENAKHQYDFVDDSEYFLFQECDYLYLPDKRVGEMMLEAAKQCDFISPYDHPDKYPHEVSDIKIIGGRHWKHTISTTSTFMARGEMVRKELDLFRGFGWEDHGRWVKLGEMGYKLYTPIPSLATHCVEGCLSPAIEWRGVV
jgi:hypothetical protein